MEKSAFGFISQDRTFSRAIEAQSTLADKTNELLKKNAETLKMATINAAKEAERPIVEIETLKQCNSNLISSINEVIKIYEPRRTEKNESTSRTL